MRLEMVKEMQIEIRIGEEFLVNSSQNRDFSASHGTESNLDFDWIWILRCLVEQIQSEIFV